MNFKLKDLISLLPLLNCVRTMRNYNSHFLTRVQSLLTVEKLRNNFKAYKNHKPAQ